MPTNRNIPENFNYDNAEKTNKNFMYKNLKRSKCYNCNFSNSNFNFSSLRGAHLKKCNFFRCSFKESEFIGSNLKGCKFREAKFINSIFEGANLDGTDFNNAEFENTIFVNCDINGVKNLKKSSIRLYEEMPKLEISDELRIAIEDSMENTYIKKSRVFDTKDGDLNPISLMILKENFDEDYLIKGLSYIKKEINRDFYTLSYVIRLIRNMI